MGAAGNASLAKLGHLRLRLSARSVGFSENVRSAIFFQISGRPFKSSPFSCDEDVSLSVGLGGCCAAEPAAGGSSFLAAGARAGEGFGDGVAAGGFGEGVDGPSARSGRGRGCSEKKRSMKAQ